MRDNAPQSHDAPALIGPGRLVLVVGPSGAGKDTLIDLARIACAGDATIRFARRVVTRDASLAEDNETMTPDAFQRAMTDGAFAVHWVAHGHHYGLRASINDDLAAGKTVVANVSRTVIDRMRSAYADVAVVVVTAPPEILAARLASRGRRSDGDAAARLGRAAPAAATSADVVIQNIGDPRDHAEHLLLVIRKIPSPAADCH